MSDNSSTDITPSLCPYCGHLFGTATGNKGEAPPSPDDICLCINCAAVLAFNSDMTVRKPTAADLASILPQQMAEIEHVRNVIRAKSRWQGDHP